MRNPIIVPDKKSTPRDEVTVFRLKLPKTADREKHKDDNDWVPQNSFWPATPCVRKDKYGYLTIMCVTLDYKHMPWGIALDTSGLPVYPVMRDEYAVKEFIKLDMDNTGNIIGRKRCLSVLHAVHYGYSKNNKGVREMCLGMDLRIYHFRPIMDLILLHHNLEKSGDLSELCVCDVNGVEIPTNIPTAQFITLSKIAAMATMSPPSEILPKGSGIGLFMRVSNDYVQLVSEERVMMLLPEKCYMYEIAMHDPELKKKALESRDLFKVDPELIKRMAPVTEKLQSAVRLLQCQRNVCCYEDEDQCDEHCSTCCIYLECVNKPSIYDIFYDELRSQENKLLKEHRAQIDHLEDMFARDAWVSSDINMTLIEFCPDLADIAKGAFINKDRVYAGEELTQLYHKMHMTYVYIIKLEAFTSWGFPYQSQYEEFINDWAHARFSMNINDREYIKQYKLLIKKKNLVQEAKKLAAELQEKTEPVMPKKEVISPEEKAEIRASFFPIKKSSSKTRKRKK